MIFCKDAFGKDRGGTEKGVEKVVHIEELKRGTIITSVIPAILKNTLCDVQLQTTNFACKPGSVSRNCFLNTVRVD